MKADQRWEEQEVRGSGKYSKSLLKTLWLSYRPFAAFLILFIILGLLGRLILLANANIIGVWVDQFCVSSADLQCHKTPEIFSKFGSKDFVLLLFQMSVVGFLLTWTFRLGFSRISARAVSKIYDETTLRTSRFPMKFFDTTPAGRVVTRFSSDYGNVFRLFGGPLAEFLSIIFDLLSMIVLISLASPFYLPLVFVIGICNYFVYRLNRKKMRASRRDLSRSRSPSIAHYAETAQGASSIRSFNKEDAFIQRFEKLDSHFQNQKAKTVRHVLNFSFQMNLLTALLLVLTGVAAYFLNAQGTLSIGAIGVAFGFVALSGNTVQMFFEWMSQVEEAMIGVERMDQYLRNDTEPGARLPASAHFSTGHWALSTAEELGNLRKRISTQSSVSLEFKSLNFRYSPELEPVLKDISFKIEAGERWGIVGRTGSGKSSLIQALFYLYPLESGEILIDGQRPRLGPGSPENLVDLEVYRRSIAFISQDPALFRGSLLENLDLRSDHSAEEIFSVLIKVGLEQWANSEGLAMNVEERGRNLSLGEKQLLCMARCLLQDAPLIVMDEATSSVDPQSEEIMVRATQELFAGRTQVIIAHRLSTLEKCDQILWLHQGKIQMMGSPAQVLPIFQQSNLSLSLPDPMVDKTDEPR